MLKEKKFIRILGYPVELIPLILIIPSLIILISLGSWQLRRLKEKEIFISSLTISLSTPSINLNEVTLNNPSLYSKILLKGKFLHNKDVFLYGRRSTAAQKDGYYLLSPFQTFDNKIIMIARGWFSAKDKIEVSNHYFEDKEEEVIGITLPPEKKRFFIPNNDLKNNIWLTLDLKQMEEVLKLKLENYYLFQIDPINLPSNIQPLSTNNLLAIKNDHLEYALTWFGLAIALIIIFIFYNKKNSVNKI